MAVANYLSSKLNISYQDALAKANKIIKSGQISYLKEEKDLTGLCYTEIRLIDNKKVKYLEIFVNNWRLAEEFLKILRWNLNGDYTLSIPKHDSLNRTFNKNGIRYIRVDGDRNIYMCRFEKREFFTYKNEDVD